MSEPAAPRHVRVVGAVIIKEDRVLCAQRADHQTLAGLWEFPGGKLEQGETPAAALAREIEEELGCTVAVGAVITTTTHAYDFALVTLTTYECALVAGEPRAREHAELRWVSRHELPALQWCPADIPAVTLIASDSPRAAH